MSETHALNQAQLAEACTNRVLDLLELGVGTPVLIIDGRAASGKSTLAKIIQEQLFKTAESLPRVIHMDDLYEGWSGLEAGSDYLHRFVLRPIAAGKRAEWQEYDWELGRRERWREFSGGTPLIVEGCGSLSQATAELAQLRVWLEVPEAIRHERWLEREGHRFDEQWPQWAAQEVEFYSRERSYQLADLRGNAN